MPPDRPAGIHDPIHERASGPWYLDIKLGPVRHKEIVSNAELKAHFLI